VCLPARDESATIGTIVETLRATVARAGGTACLVDDIVVVDDGSTDATLDVAAAAGATAVRAREVLTGCGPAAGKGEALWKSLHVATGDVVVFCDADVVGFEAHFVTRLLAPLLTRDDIAFVKGHYERPLDGVAGAGGRVTELVARPLVDLFFPHLAGIRQPLAGEFAARREVLERVPFVLGYGVDLALLVDVVDLVGMPAVGQADLGSRTHRNRSVEELGAQAREVMRTALARAGAGDLVGWGSAGREERPPISTVAAYRARRRGRTPSASQPTTTSRTHPAASAVERSTPKRSVRATTATPSGSTGSASLSTSPTTTNTGTPAA